MIRLYGDPVLEVHCDPVMKFDSTLADLGEELGRETHASGGWAVAAPQIGQSVSAFFYRLNDGDQGLIVNPYITDGSGSWMYKEGCLSLPGRYWWISRPNQVTLHYYDVNGKRHSRVDDTFTARLWQHEVDHLNGRLIVSRLTTNEKKKLRRELAKSNG